MHGQKSREYLYNKHEIERTANDPLLKMEHTWALEGFVPPIGNFNLWEKSFLITGKNPDTMILKMVTRVNPHGRKSIDQERVRRIPMDLSVFRPEAKTPLTDEQKEQLRLLQNSIKKRFFLGIENCL
jgi:hypothetical protein